MGGKWRLFNLKNADLLGFQRLLMFDSYQVRVSERTNTLQLPECQGTLGSLQGTPFAISED